VTGNRATGNRATGDRVTGDRVTGNRVGIARERSLACRSRRATRSS